MTVLAVASFDSRGRTRESLSMIPPQLPVLTGAFGGWIVLGFKIAAAAGFVAAANLVVLYAS